MFEGTRNQEAAYARSRIKAETAISVVGLFLTCMPTFSFMSFYCPIPKGRLLKRQHEVVYATFWEKMLIGISQEMWKDIVKI